MSLRTCADCARITHHGTRCELGCAVFPHAEVCGQFQDFHRGGCGHCSHGRGGKCRDPQLPKPLTYTEARSSQRPCGPTARRWVRWGFEGWRADDIERLLAAHATGDTP
jgi:hypothetical protein